MAIFPTYKIDHLITGTGINRAFSDTNASFSCDSRQHCRQMTSRAEAEYFIKHCPNTKMDGDRDGILCENDSGFNGLNG